MDQPQPKPIEQQKNHSRRKWLWIWLGIIVLIPVLFFGYTGVYNIPVVSAMFGAAKPKDLGISVSETAFASLTAKVPLQVQGTASGFSVFGEKTYTGSKPSENTASSEEISSWIDHYTKNDGDIKQTQVKFIEGGMEISTFFNRYVHAPVYVKVMVSRTGANSVSLDVQKGSIGRFPVPAKYVKMFSDYAEKVLNEHLADIPGFSMTALEYHNGSRYFKGTYPATVSAATGGSWW